MSAEDVLAAALKLPHRERAQVASELLKSLDELSEAECEELWHQEVDRRIRAARAGNRKGIPSEEVFARGRALTSP